MRRNQRKAKTVKPLERISEVIGAIKRSISEEFIENRISKVIMMLKRKRKRSLEVKRSLVVVCKQNLAKHREEKKTQRNHNGSLNLVEESE